MIKALRITGIFAAILAAVFFFLPVLFGVGADSRIEEFLSEPGAIEEFNKARNKSIGGVAAETSPLVKEALAFASYLSPPAAVSRNIPSSSARAADIPRPTTVSAKFTLIGTSYYPLCPEKSMVLIEQPAEGLHWVRQSSQVGHLVIEQVTDGRVLVRDGERTFELIAERPERRSLVRNGPAAAGESEARAGIAGRAVSTFSGSTSSRGPAGGSIDLMQSVISELKSMQEKASKVAENDSESAVSVSRSGSSIVSTRGAGAAGRENADLMQLVIEELQGMRIGTEEAEKLGNLGEKLEESRHDVNQPPEPNSKIESIRRSRPVRRRTRR